MDRNRTTKTTAPVPDIDCMTMVELQAFVDSTKGQSSTSDKYKSWTSWARELFPDRPLHFTTAARMLYSCARRRLHGIPYEVCYRRLPAWAQYRKTWNIEAAVLPGKKFRKHVPRKKGKI